jgi:hypothetical protein
MSVNSSAMTKPATAKRGFFSGVGCWGSLVVILVSLFLYVIACVAPAMVFDKETWRGFEVLLSGWMGVFLGQFAWFANLFWGLSLLLALLRRWFLTMAATILTFLIALDAFSFVGAKVPLDEAFVNSMIFRSYHIGFYFWLASIAAVGIGAMVVWVIERIDKARLAAQVAGKTSM